MKRDVIRRACGPVEQKRIRCLSYCSNVLNTWKPAWIAEVNAAHRRGDLVPDVTYTAEEDKVWRVVSVKLAEYLIGAKQLVLRPSACRNYGRLTSGSAT
jgi:hypothetical protein